MVQNIRVSHLSVRRSELWQNADWIRMPFGVVRGVGRWMGVLDGVVIVEGEGAVFGGEFGASHCNQ